MIAKRYEQTATVVTSNLDFTEWNQAFPAKRQLASATLGRFRHNAYCLVLDGTSYRAPKFKPRRNQTRGYKRIQKARALNPARMPVSFT